MEDRTTFRISCMYISSVPIFIVETAILKLHLYDYDGNVIHLPRTSHTILYPGHLTLYSTQDTSHTIHLPRTPHTLYSTQDISHYTLPRTSHTILYPGHLTHYTPTQDTSHTILYPGHLTSWPGPHLRRIFIH